MSARPRYVSAAPLGLTERMLDYLRCAAEGATCEETAEALVVSIEGVKSTRRSILLRTDAKNICHAAHLAHIAGVFDGKESS